MKTKDWVLAAIEAFLWYNFIYYFLYSIKTDVDLSKNAFILLLLGYAASICCPWVRHTQAWKQLDPFGK